MPPPIGGDIFRLSGNPLVRQHPIASPGEKLSGHRLFGTDDLTEEEVILTMEYTSDLQRNLDVKYSKMYLSLIDKLYVCDLTQVDHLHHPTKCTSHDISRKMCKEFFLKAL